MTTRLENGLTLLVRENHATPLVAIDLWVRCGAGDEPPALSGVSHFLEHMVFKGSARLAVGEFDRRIENMGGYLNAATSQDFTHYYVTVPSRFFAEALADLVDVVARPLLDPEEFGKERLVVLEEIRRKQDNPTGFLYEKVFEESFEEGPYKRPVLGSPETVGAMTRDRMAAYHAAHYRPEAMTLVVVGDVAGATVVEEARRHLGDLERHPPGDAPKLGALVDIAPVPREGVYRWGVRCEIPREVRETYLMIAFPSAGIGGGAEDPDVFGLEVVAHILGGGRASRLWQTVREEKRLVSSVGVHNLSLRRESLLLVVATLEARHLVAAREAILAEIERFVRRGPTAAELARTRKTLVNDFLYQNETNAGQSSTLGYFFTQTGDATFAERYLDALGALDRRAIRQSAARHLDPRHANVLTVVPAPERGKSTESPTD